MLLIEATDNPRPVHKLCHQTQHPKQDLWLANCNFASHRTRNNALHRLAVCISKPLFILARHGVSFFPERRKSRKPKPMYLQVSQRLNRTRSRPVT
jgi:hypothetical protein